MNRRAFTIIELVLTLTLTVFIVSAATGLYAFVAVRTADAVAQYNTINQANDLLNAMESTIEQALSCEVRTVSGKAMLMCQVPNSGQDFDVDGYLESVTPDSISKMNRETYNPGRCIWFYTAGITGVPTSTGSYWFRSSRSDTLDVTTPGAGTQIDNKFSFLGNNNPRVFLPTVSATFSTSPVLKTTTVTLVVSPEETRPGEDLLVKARRAGQITLVRTFYWRSFN